ncbi:pyruvate ferredoxin oxidoreductase subunit gamma [Candidatus Formimonas warabiya]|uniref:Pyruvate ferredoxin oxidoreductase n=1 Tax=Formimonas warabiya TaxID=1761012 RepID=A0A3G1KV41_FORW1|nr:pyruvate ferredoxin oxidoreductase subunit gamma [Candidatus Formimonas warabiya]ATW26319.1 pyruvate ferredoxin oxidoreductase [Candidatus Formimonas warabiya]
MKEIRIHGRGGQGGVTAAGIIGGAAVKEGKYAQAFPAFGAERRGAPVLSFTRISDTPIRNRSQVYHPDIVIVFDEGLLTTVDVSAGIKENGMIIINTEKKPEDFAFKNPAQVVTVDATSISLNALGRPIVNTTILGTLCAATDVIQLAFLKDAVKEQFGGSLGEKNVKALEEAYKQYKGGA